jgi:protein-disulfide isomerase
MLKQHATAIAVLFAVGLSLAHAAPANAQTRATSRASSNDAGGSEGNKAYGSKNAPITMEVFSDYQCPSCRALYEETLKPLIADYVALGKVYLIHRDFPLPMHSHSWVAARYANAAARIGKFPQVEAALYDNQAEWSESGDLEKYVAAGVGPTDMKKIDKLMPAGCKVQPPAPGAPSSAPLVLAPCPLDPAIQRDSDLGKKVPVAATPTFQVICKGKTTTTAGTVTYPVLKQYFDYLLSH